MSPYFGNRQRLLSAKSFILTGTALAVAGWAGCNTPASRTKSGAATGAATGAAIGLLAGSNSNAGPLAGLAAGTVAGAGIGAIVGAIQQRNENKAQAEMQQERAYAAEVAARRKVEAIEKANQENELAVAQGFQITDVELDAAKKRLDEAETKAKGLQQEMADAAAKTKALADMKDKTLQLEAMIAQQTEILARLKGENLSAPAKK